MNIGETMCATAPPSGSMYMQLPGGQHPMQVSQSSGQPYSMSVLPGANSGTGMPPIVWVPMALVPVDSRLCPVNGATTPGPQTTPSASTSHYPFVFPNVAPHSPAVAASSHDPSSQHSAGGMPAPLTTPPSQQVTPGTAHWLTDKHHSAVPRHIPTNDVSCSGEVPGSLSTPCGHAHVPISGQPYSGHRAQPKPMTSYNRAPSPAPVLATSTGHSSHDGDHPLSPTNVQSVSMAADGCPLAGHTTAATNNYSDMTSMGLVEQETTQEEAEAIGEPETEGTDLQGQQSTASPAADTSTEQSEPATTAENPDDTTSQQQGVGDNASVHPASPGSPEQRTEQTSIRENYVVLPPVFDSEEERLRSCPSGYMLRQSLKSPTPMPHELSPYPSPYASAFSSRLTRRRTIGTTKATVTTPPGGPVSPATPNSDQMLFRCPVCDLLFKKEEACRFHISKHSKSKLAKAAGPAPPPAGPAPPPAGPTPPPGGLQTLKRSPRAKTTK
ncbi:nascent polypeptide-associated complex subunit alpha, muscle-specific form-like [Sycon ciliatum]|uniref:nascent polypeptide-associated complex subunit alpha, muscle-specific form-like n=1 Tax=Sycon ciliatum TaxID=27933 RepID=UPI0031F67D66